MTHEKVKQVTAKYRRQLVKAKSTPVAYPHDKIVATPNDAIQHIHNMLDQIDTFVDEGRLEKAFRWLGFVQGVLWALGLSDLDELKNDNRP